MYWCGLLKASCQQQKLIDILYIHAKAFYLQATSNVLRYGPYHRSKLQSTILSN